MSARERMLETVKSINDELEKEAVVNRIEYKGTHYTVTLRQYAVLRYGTTLMIERNARYEYTTPHGLTYQYDTERAVRNVVDFYLRKDLIFDPPVYINRGAGDILKLSPYYIEDDMVFGLSDGESTVDCYNVWLSDPVFAPFEDKFTDATRAHIDEESYSLYGEFVSRLDSFIEKLLAIQDEMNDAFNSKLNLSEED